MKKFIIIFLFLLTITAAGVLLFYHKASPIMKINGDKKMTINLNDKYEEQGAELSIFDKNISKYIKIEGDVDTTKTGEYTITYSFKSKYMKKEVQEKRIISVIDRTAPVIELQGGEITINQGSEYKEPGFKAEDDYDGDLTETVEVTNDIDKKQPGEYTVTYSVTDSSGNKYHINRKVIVKKTTTTTKKTTTKDPNKDGDSSKVSNSKGSGRGIAILMYHYFYDEDAGETGANSNWMEIDDFEAQLKYLTDNKYYFPSWQEVQNYVNGKITLPEKSIVVTIDDGHKTLFSHAIPLLEKYNVKATAFIITSKSAAKKFEKYKSDNIQFQSHTHNMHQGGCSGGHGGLFRCINYDLGLEDLNKSISILGSNDAIAYPYGDVTKNVIKITESAKFKVGVTTKYGRAKKGMDPLQLPRIRMYKGMSLSGFKNAI